VAEERGCIGAGGRRVSAGGEEDRRLHASLHGARHEHCGGGPGPNTFDAVTALSNWVEKKQAPDRLLGSHMTNGVADLTRPLCPYPQVATVLRTRRREGRSEFQLQMPR
jgi:hypothetical protein